VGSADLFAESLSNLTINKQKNKSIG